MHNDTGKAFVLFIYPIKHLSKPILLYESFFDKTMLLYK